MSDEARAILTGLIIVAVIILGAISFGVINAMHRRDTALKMVEAGAEPLAAACALGISDVNDPCLLANRK